MPTRNVDLTDALDQFVAARIESGRYQNASEVVRAGLSALQERERAHAEQLAYLRSEAENGFAELDRGEGIETTPDELMDGIELELGITA